MSPELRNYDPYLGPRSRQGRFTLAVGVSLALVAVTAGLLWTTARESADGVDPEFTPIDSPTPIIQGETWFNEQVHEI